MDFSHRTYVLPINALITASQHLEIFDAKIIMILQI